MNIFIENAIIIFETCYLKSNNRKLTTITFWYGCDYEGQPFKSFFSKKATTHECVK